jgi:membrane protease YdiL (CAAX protease family)
MSQEFHNFSTSLHDEIQADADVQLALEDLPGEPGLGLREHAGRLIEGYNTWAEKYPFAATAVETAVVLAAKKAVEFAGDKMGFNARNALKEDHIEAAATHPVKAAVHAVVLAPVAEELQFRGPSWLRRHVGDRQPSRILDCVTALGFAAGHAGVVKPAKNWTKSPFVEVSAENLSVPVVPLIGGINYERLSRRRGFGHAVFAHALNNALESIQVVPEVRCRRRK